MLNPTEIHETLKLNEEHYSVTKIALKQLIKVTKWSSTNLLKIPVIMEKEKVVDDRCLTATYSVKFKRDELQKKLRQMLGTFDVFRRIANVWNDENCNKNLG